MPSLLLKRAYKKDCQNEEEKLEKGNEYKRQDADMGAGAGSHYGHGKSGVTSYRDNTDFSVVNSECGYFTA